MSELELVMSRTDWADLNEQKLDLLECISQGASLSLMGLVNWIDAIQDAVVDDGYDEAVVFGELED